MNARPQLSRSAAAVALALAACSFDTTGVQFDGAGADIDAAISLSDSAPTAPDAAVSPPDARPPTPGVAEAGAAPAITLDGDPAEWTDARWYRLDVASAAQQVGCGPPYSASKEARFALLHDSEFIYLFVEVTDDLVHFDSTALYEDDSISLYLDAAGDRSGTFGVDDHELVVSAEGTFTDYNPIASNVALNGELTETPAGYNAELRLTKTSLGASPLPAELGFDLALSDDDDLGTADADCYGLWFEAEGPHCPTCCPGDDPRAWCDTTVFGSLQLL